ncbi:histidine kinase N-terminal 7TM domain-containing protein [Haladaptatus sp. GCM10025893]|uniref:histidine kinase N-terminal 7TM domain-containing protein n=1 Tax=Haladaptatus sp. GCM10025893 TaxID=3252659 RepID=UPI00360DB4EE
MVRLEPTPVPLPFDLLVLMLAAVLTGGAATVFAWRQRPEPGATALAVLMAAATWWSGMYILELNAATLMGKLFWARMQWAGSVTVPVAWVVFALEYTGNDEYVNPRNIVLLGAIPALTVVLVWTNEAHLLVRHSVGLRLVGDTLVMTQTFGPWFWVIIGYSYILALVGDLLFFNLLENSPIIHRKQAIAILLAALAPWVGNLIYVGDLLPWVAVDPTPVAFTVSGIASLGAISQYKLLDASPAPGRLARTFVVDEMADGVVVVDSTGRIVDVNQSAAAVIGAVPLDLLGTQLDETFQGYDQLSTKPTEGTEPVTLGTGGDERHYEVSRTDLRDYHDRVIGRVLVLRDVTERFRYQQRLDVLNRVLRHNLRNEMNVVLGFADRLEAGGGDPALTNRLRQKALHLVDMGNKARAIQEIIDSDHADLMQISVAPIIEAAAAAVSTAHPNVAVRVKSLPPESTTCGWVIEPAIENLLENAAEHNTNDRPEATITGSVSGEWLTISVTDNGPGIPETELEVLDMGHETALLHSQGLGLWLANWAVKALDGELTFAENHPEGTTVTIRVPLDRGAEDTEATK